MNAEKDGCLNPSDAGIDSLIGWQGTRNEAQNNCLNPSDAGIDSLIAYCSCIEI